MEIKRNDVWMTAEEMNFVLDQPEFGSDRWIAMSLLGRCGLKSAEAIDVSPSDVVDTESPMLLDVIGKGKVNRRRRVPIPRDLAVIIKTHNTDIDRQSLRETNFDTLEPIINKTDRTVRQWVIDCRQDLVEKTGNEDWNCLSPKSFRHSWADILLKSGIPPKTVMRWGGWNNERNFHELYIADPTESDYSQVYETGLFSSSLPREASDGRNSEY